MPAFVVTVQEVSRREVATLTYSALLAAADYWEVPNDGRTLLRVHNGDPANQTATVEVEAKLDGQDVSDRVYTIPGGGEERWFGPFPVDWYGSTLTVRASVGNQMRITAVRPAAD